jgi:hypothetical protein
MLTSVAAMTAMTRGPLPARVYWVRRAMVLGTALLLVVGVARLLGGGGDADPEPEGAVRVAAAEPSASASLRPVVSPRAQEASRGGTGEQSRKRKQQKAEPVLVDPEGVCTADDIAVTPLVKHAEAGRDVPIVLELRTIEAAACTWQVSPETLTVQITSGDDDIWSSRQCPKAVPTERVVVRQAATTEVEMRWSGRRSDEECSDLAGWAMPGWYHVAAAALAGEPSDVQFELERPRPEVVVQTVPAKPGKGERDGGAGGRGQDAEQGPPKHR